ncbi:MAG: hypothetical protein DCC73_05605 [Proteobacteria bacterium]|nr:MAG: hypothetical protein DCC73_05605 [Pseudomonadota bacterium]
MSGEMKITYLDWSGFRIDRQDRAAIFLDPPAKAALPGDRPLLIFLSHGHPEHLAGTRNYLSQMGSKAVATIIASGSVCRHLAGHTQASGVTFKPVRPGDQVRFSDDVSVNVFRWKHLPLLPPGVMPSVRHIAHLLSNLSLAAKIAWAGAQGPRAEPMLGFHLHLGGWEVLAYGEGLHHKCDHVVKGRGALGTVALAGVEPGDEAAMAALIRASAASETMLYEPHAKWRDAFGMPRVDLGALQADLRAQGIAARIAAADQAERFAPELQAVR